MGMVWGLGVVGFNKIGRVETDSKTDRPKEPVELKEVKIVAVK